MLCTNRNNYITGIIQNNINWELYRKQRNLGTKIKKNSIETYFYERCI